MSFPFGHLHVHTEYSLLDGCARIEELFATAKELGHTFCAVTDHGSTSGLLAAQQAAHRHGVVPILGTEFYYQRENDGQNGHLLVLAKDNVGLRNIFELQEYAYVHNFYYKPRIKWEILRQHAEGLIVTSACLGSTFAQYILEGEITQAMEWATKFKHVFGEDFYLEIQPNGMPEQLTLNRQAIAIGKKLGIKVVATNDVHYIHEADAFPHEVLLALQINKKMSDESRWKFPTYDLWFKSAEDMKQTFVGLDEEDVCQALQHTAEIAGKCRAGLEKGNYLPAFYNLPEGMSERELLAQHIMDGAKRTGFIHNPDYMKEVQHELDIIDRNGYSGYFLIVRDYVTTARENGIIVGDGRGSGAGSKVAFLTDIARIEPSKHKLLFERFMADGRSPDFDVDFSDQESVFADLQKKYGVENVARIIAFGHMTPKAVCRKVLNCFEHPYDVINHVTKLIPELCPSLKEAYKHAPALLDYKEKYKVEFEVIERLEGTISHESQHAGGVLIYPGLSSLLPVKTRGQDRTMRIVGFDKNMLEDLGHYKFDILGLDTLPVIKRCLDSIKEIEGVDIDLYALDYDDANVYTMLCEGDVSGVFQLGGQAQKVTEQQPRDFKDLIAINALIRPGIGDWHEYIARRKGKPWEIHPDRMDYLGETEGVMTYQEQFLLDCKTFAGWDIAYADKHVRKNKDIVSDTILSDAFVDAALSRGYTHEEVAPVWREILAAVEGGYSFNKSHSASYAVISFQTAWLKCYYPEHFYASLMSGEATDGPGQIAIAGYIAECKKRGITILPPDINNSNENFVVVPKLTMGTTQGGVQYRITTIRHVGESAITHIQELRPVDSFGDFMRRREKKHIKKNVLVNLIKAGCFDQDNPNRAELLWQVDMDHRTKTQIKEEYEPPRYEWNEKVKAEWEKEVLGMYLSVHPMEQYGFHPIDHYEEGARALQGGEVSEVKVFKDRNQNEMAFVTLDTLHGGVKVIVFNSVWKNKLNQHALAPGNIVLIKGRRSGHDILMDEAEVLEEQTLSEV